MRPFLISIPFDNNGADWRQELFSNLEGVWYVWTINTGCPDNTTSFLTTRQPPLKSSLLYEMKFDIFHLCFFCIDTEAVHHLSFPQDSKVLRGRSKMTSPGGGGRGSDRLVTNGDKRGGRYWQAVTSPSKKNYLNISFCILLKHISQ